MKVVGAHNLSKPAFARFDVLAHPVNTLAFANKVISDLAVHRDAQPERLRLVLQPIELYAQ